MDAPLALLKTFPLQVTGAELAQLHQALVYNAESPSSLLSELIEKVVTDDRIHYRYDPEDPDCHEKYRARVEAELTAFYSQNETRELSFLIPAEYHSACYRALGRAERGQFTAKETQAASLRRWLRLTKIDPAACKKLRARLKATPIQAPRLPKALLTPEGQIARESPQATDDVTEAMGIG